MVVTRIPRRASIMGGMAPWSLALVLLAGCALEPTPTSDDLRHEVLPDTGVPPQWTGGPTTAGDVAGDWLASFEDPQLEALVTEAIAHNADLRVAAARVEQAAAYTRIAGGELYPAVDLLARGGGEMSGDNSGLEGVLVSASWELDLWGRVRYTRRAATDQYASAEADFVYARQSLAAQVAKSWFLATEAALQRKLLSEVVAAATKLLELADHRWDVGIGSEFDVASAKVNLETYQDRQREVELAYVQALRALELLVGRYPAAEITARAEFGALPPRIPAGLPSELLERRPDVIAAQKRVAAAFSRVKESQAARLPRISVSEISKDEPLSPSSNFTWMPPPRFAAIPSAMTLRSMSIEASISSTNRPAPVLEAWCSVNTVSVIVRAAPSWSTACRPPPLLEAVL